MNVFKTTDSHALSLAAIRLAKDDKEPKTLMNNMLGYLIWPNIIRKRLTQNHPA